MSLVCGLLSCSAPAAKLQLLVAAVACTLGWAKLGGALAPGQETTALTASSGETAEFTMLHHRLADPIDAGIIADDLVGWINHDNLIPLVDSIGGHPVGVQDSQRAALAANTLLSNTFLRAPGLDLVDTMALWLSVDNTLGDSLLSATALDSNTIDQVALLCLVAKLACLVCTSWTGGTMNGWELAELPGADTLEEAHDIRLFLPP